MSRSATLVAGASIVLIALLGIARLGMPANAAESAQYLYTLHCAGCHGADGTGSKTGRIPPFQNIIGHFLRLPEGRAYLALVPGVANSGLDDGATAAVLNYVIDAWVSDAMPNGTPRYSASEITQIRRRRIDDISALRRQLAAKLARRGIDVSY